MSNAQVNQRLAFAICLVILAVFFYIDIDQGFRYPWSDELDFIPILTGSTPITWKWLWAQHNEHRIVIPKLVYFLSFKAWPDFRLPILICIVLMGYCSFVMMSITQRIRGFNPLLQLCFPMLLLNMTLGYHGWGFHVQFTSSTFLLCLLLSSIVYTQTKTDPSIVGLPALAVSVILLLLPLCGMNGVIPSLILIPYYLIRSSNQAVSASIPQARLWGKVILLSAVMAGSIICMIFIGYYSIPHPWGNPNILELITATMHVLSSPLNFGSAGLMAGIVICFLVIFVITRIAQDIRRNNDTECKINWGKADLFAFIISLCTLAIGLGWGRGGRGWPLGLDNHYSLLMVPLLCAVFVVCMISNLRKIVYSLWIITLIMFCIHGVSAIRSHKYVGDRSRKIDRTIEAGANIDKIVSLHINDLFFVDNEYARKVVRRGLLDLHQYFILNSLSGKIAEIRE